MASTGSEILWSELHTLTETNATNATYLDTRATSSTLINYYELEHPSTTTRLDTWSYNTTPYVFDSTYRPTDFVYHVDLNYVDGFYIVTGHLCYDDYIHNSGVPLTWDSMFPSDADKEQVMTDLQSQGDLFFVIDKSGSFDSSPDTTGCYCKSLVQVIGDSTHIIFNAVDEPMCSCQSLKFPVIGQRIGKEQDIVPIGELNAHYFMPESTDSSFWSYVITPGVRAVKMTSRCVDDTSIDAEFVYDHVSTPVAGWHISSVSVAMAGVYTWPVRKAFYTALWNAAPICKYGMYAQPVSVLDRSNSPNHKPTCASVSWDDLVYTQYMNSYEGDTGSFDYTTTMPLDTAYHDEDECDSKGVTVYASTYNEINDTLNALESSVYPCCQQFLYNTSSQTLGYTGTPVIQINGYIQAYTFNGFKTGYIELGTTLYTTGNNYNLSASDATFTKYLDYTDVSTAPNTYTQNYSQCWTRVGCSSGGCYAAYSSSGTASVNPTPTAGYPDIVTITVDETSVELEHTAGSTETRTVSLSTAKHPIDAVTPAVSDYNGLSGLSLDLTVGYAGTVFDNFPIADSFTVTSFDIDPSLLSSDTTANVYVLTLDSSGSGYANIDNHVLTNSDSIIQVTPTDTTFKAYIGISDANCDCPFGSNLNFALIAGFYTVQFYKADASKPVGLVDYTNVTTTETFSNGATYTDAFSSSGSDGFTETFTTSATPASLTSTTTTESGIPTWTLNSEKSYPSFFIPYINPTFGFSSFTFGSVSLDRAKLDGVYFIGGPPGTGGATISWNEDTEVDGVLTSVPYTWVSTATATDWGITSAYNVTVDNNSDTPGYFSVYLTGLTWP